MGRTQRTTADPNRMVGYTRVSTDEQAGTGLGLAAQRAAVSTEAERRGWNLVAIHEDALSGRSLDRPGLAAALAAVEAGEAAGLVVAKLDRLSRSLRDFADLMARAQSRGWNLVALDLGVDLSTAAGEFMANVMASAAQWERRIIGQRTREALAAKRAQGVKLGRPQALPQAVVERIVAARNGGEGWSSIARLLNAEDVATAHGGARWHPSTVRAVALANAAATAFGPDSPALGGPAPPSTTLSQGRHPLAL
jgi:DNA invertase Pin-like site-specific DNA recombinase